MRAMRFCRKALFSILGLHWGYIGVMLGLHWGYTGAIYIYICIYICVLKASQDVKCRRRCDASTDPQNQFDGPKSAASSSNLVGVPTNCNE